jgi:hypothetical protein
LDAVDMHHGRVESWLQDNPGKQLKDLLQQFISVGAFAFLFKATEGKTFADPKFRDLVSTAADLGVTHIGAYLVNLRGDAGLDRVDDEIALYMKQIEGLPIGATMVDWETWAMKNAAGEIVARPPDDPLTGGTVDQTVLLLSKLEQARPGRVLLYSGFPMLPRKANDPRLLSFPWVFPDYRSASGADPVSAATTVGLADAGTRMVMHQWGAQHGVMGFDSSRVIDRPRFDAVFGQSGSGGRVTTNVDTTTEAIVNQLPDINAGDRGDHVKRMQALLLAAGFSPGTLDGLYTTSPTSPTRGALVNFQNSRGIPQDAKVTIGVWQALLGV